MAEPGIRTRSRTLDSDKLITAQYLYYRRHANWPVVGPYLVNSGVSKTSEFSESMTDYVTPQYQRLSKRGYVINNDMTQQKNELWNASWPISFQRRYDFTTSSGAGYWTGEGLYDYPTFRTRMQYNPFLNLADPVIDVSGMVAAAVTETHAKIGESPWLAMVAAGEARETYMTFVRYIKQAVGFLRRARRLKSVKLKLSPKQIQEEWMSIRYGLRPIVYDIRNLMEAYNTLGLPVRSRYASFRKAANTVTRTTSKTWNNSIDPVINGLCSTDIETIKREVFVYAGVMCEHKVDTVRYDSVLGLRNQDMLPSMWELVPYSFVVDWFLNIGDLIASWSPKGDCTVKASWVKTVQVRTKTLECTDWRVLPGYKEGVFYDGRQVLSTTAHTYAATGGGYRHRTTDVSRVANPNKPLLPVVEIRLDIAKLVDLLILLKQCR